MTIKIEGNAAMTWTGPKEVIADYFSGTPKEGQIYGLQVVGFPADTESPDVVTVVLQFVPINV